MNFEANLRVIGRLGLARTSTNNTGWQFYTVTLWATEQLLTCLLWLFAYSLARSSLFLAYKEERGDETRETEVAANIQFVFFGVIAQFRPIFSLSLPARAPASPVRDSFLPFFPALAASAAERSGISQSARCPRRCARPIRAKKVAHAVRNEARASEVSLCLSGQLSLSSGLVRGARGK